MRVVETKKGSQRHTRVSLSPQCIRDRLERKRRQMAGGGGYRSIKDFYFCFGSYLKTENEEGVDHPSTLVSCLCAGPT